MGKFEKRQKCVEWESIKSIENNKH